jgi:hypothetical protein
MDLRPPLEAALGAFALPAVVTLPGGDPVDTRAFWLRYRTEESQVSAEFRRSEARRVLVLPRVDVPQVPRGTVIAMAEYEGGPVLEWRSDSMESFQIDHHRIVVVPLEAAS